MNRLAAVLETAAAERRAKSLEIVAKPAGSPFWRRPKLVCCRRCTQFVAVVFDGAQADAGTLLLDAEPHADGSLVLVEDNWHPCAVGFDAAAHAGWRRWRTHDCAQSIANK